MLTKDPTIYLISIFFTNLAAKSKNPKIHTLHIGYFVGCDSIAVEYMVFWACGKKRDVPSLKMVRISLTSFSLL